MLVQQQWLSVLSQVQKHRPQVFANHLTTSRCPFTRAFRNAHALPARMSMVRPLAFHTHLATSSLPSRHAT
jgi:hypothetical protein